tara:strand:- start:10072 stop:11028 length:957 start_codon:yes stop_codon:yes gene_type:complete
VDTKRGREMQITRRELILISSIGGLAGCIDQSEKRLQGGKSFDRESIYFLVAGSLLTSMERGLKNEVQIPLRIEAHGSVSIAQMVKAGLKNPDIISVSDPILFEGVIKPKWHVEFATNQMVIAYNKDTDAGKLIADSGLKKWYEPILEYDMKIGRTDPDLDPLGYRTLFLLDLSEQYYEEANLKEKILSKSLVLPEIELMSYFEIGGVDVAIVYKNMAVERGYDYVELPSEINLGSPEKVDEWYSKTEYKLQTGEKITGDVIKYASTIWTEKTDSEVIDVFQNHISGGYLLESGFVLPERYPRILGDIPKKIERAITS